MPVPLIPVEQLRQYADAEIVENQRLARIFDLIAFHRSNGTRLDNTGRPILRASAQRKVDRRLAGIKAVTDLQSPPEHRDMSDSTSHAPAIPTLSPNEALLRLVSI